MQSVKTVLKLSQLKLTGHDTKILMSDFQRKFSMESFRIKSEYGKLKPKLIALGLTLSETLLIVILKRSVFSLVTITVLCILRRQVQLLMKNIIPSLKYELEH